MADLKMMLQNLRDKSKCCKKDDFTGERYTIIHDMSIETLNMICDDGIEQLENSQTVNHWIPCSERMPEINQRVLVYVFSPKYGDYVMRSGECCGEHLWHTDNGTTWETEEIIGWMPMPEPPERSDDE